MTHIVPILCLIVFIAFVEFKLFKKFKDIEEKFEILREQIKKNQDAIKEKYINKCSGKYEGTSYK